ncbi:MAG TPA: GtrA family protein [Parvularculaceae bacterium]|nr:GtrA family protein [Amphiplicatus sp.]HPE32057.1 GtrA family protein [Parvularculaceae bacterium]HRX39904.1 GtrA family protein [Parvularculaceae bacterium]
MTEEKRDLRNVARREGGRMARFGGVGVANTIVDLIVFSALVAAQVPPVAANIASFLAGNLQSYLLNSRITFRVEGAPAPLSLRGYSKFLAAHLFSLALSTAVLLLLAHRIGPMPAKGVAILLGFVCNYAASAFFVFGASHGERRGA